MIGPTFRVTSSLAVSITESMSYCVEPATTRLPSGVTIRLCRPPLGETSIFLSSLPVSPSTTLTCGIAAPETAGHVELLAVGRDADAVAAAFLLGVLVLPEDLLGLQVQAQELVVAVGDPHLAGGGAAAGAAGAAELGHGDELDQLVAVVDVVDVDALVALAAGPVARGDVEQPLQGGLLVRPRERAEEERRVRRGSGRIAWVPPYSS